MLVCASNICSAGKKNHEYGDLRPCPRRQHVDGHVEPAHRKERLSCRRPAGPAVLGRECFVPKAHGHAAFAMALADEHDHTLTDHIGQVSGLITRHDLREVILVAHSYGGMVITGVAAGMPERIRRLVYVDAALPDPGQSLFDLFARSKVGPFSFPGLEAASAYVEKLQFDTRKITPLPKTCILCTGSEFAVVTRDAKRKIAAQKTSWTYRELPTSHVPMATMPERFNRILLEAVNGRE